jgi:DNA-binding GntR family transcriptional regulator
VTVRPRTAPVTRLKRVPRHKKAIADEQMHQAITDALMAGDLPPETRLGEHQLAAIFGVTRARVRTVLHRLVHEKRLVLIPNRGVFVPMPSPEEAREVYFARRLIEKGVVAELATRARAGGLEKIAAHVKLEHDVAARGDRHLSIKQSGAFHLLLVDMMENVELSRFLRELISRSSLIVSLFEPMGLSSCAVDEHDFIADAIARHDVEAAQRHMDDHLAGIETRLRFRRPHGGKPDLASVLMKTRTHK